MQSSKGKTVRVFLISAVTTAVFAGMAARATAATSAQDPLYAAQYAGRSAYGITIPAGQTLNVWVEYTNTGRAEWKNEGAHLVALNATKPAGRVSAFRNAAWERSFRPARFQEPTVKPGETGRVSFTLAAPKKTGRYKEVFRLAAKDAAWVKGSIVRIAVTVTPPPPAYQAELVRQSAPALTMEAGSTATFWADFKNVGARAWKPTGEHYVALNAVEPAGRVSAFKSVSWIDANQTTKLEQQRVSWNHTGRVSFTLQAPQQPGVYMENFQLSANKLKFIKGGVVTVTITVTAPPVGRSANEPVIAVGITTMTNSAVISANGNVSIYANGIKVGTADAHANVTLSYANGTYTVTGASVPLSGASSYTVTPDADSSILTAIHYEHRPSWDTTRNDNMFRGGLELRYAEVTGKLWLINHLPMEQYLRGIAESSNTAPMEFLKALTIAARTYAQYHYNTGTKHAAEHFTVDATHDQVYRGYGMEYRSPNVVQAVQDTSGMEVTYGGAVVITPYYSHSDGRTRDWTEVGWNGGPYPWLVSVPVPQDIASGYTSLYGHGVGMSAHAALVMASDEGKTYDQILTYFYTGVSIQKIY